MAHPNVPDNVAEDVFFRYYYDDDDDHQPAPPLSAQSQEYHAELKEIFPVVISSDDSDTGSRASSCASSESFLSFASDNSAANAHYARLEAERMKKEQRDIVTQHALAWVLNLDFRKLAKGVDLMKEQAKNLDPEHKEMFDNLLCDYYDKRHLWERLQETTRLLPEATCEALAKMPGFVHDMCELIKEEPQRFYGMEAEIKAFRTACNAWEQRRYAPTLKKARLDPFIFTSDFASDAEDLGLTPYELEQMAAIEKMEEEKRKEQWEQLTRFLQLLDLQPVPTPRDGACLFTAIGHTLGKCGKDVRLDVVGALLSMRDMKLLEVPFEQFCCDTTGVPNFYQYVENMRKQDVWGGQPELFAASWLYNKKICVKDTTTGLDQNTHMPGREPDDTIVIVWDGNHYTATEPLQ